MGKYRTTLVVDWRRNGEQGQQANIPVEFFAPGVGFNRVGSEQCKTPGEVLGLFEMANGERNLTLYLKTPYANLYLRPYWTIDRIVFEIFEVNRRVAQATGKFPRIAKYAPYTIAGSSTNMHMITLSYLGTDEAFEASRG